MQEVSDEAILRERHKAKAFGCLLYMIAIIIMVVGWIIWKWYAVPTTIAIFIIFGCLYSFIKSRQMTKKTGLTIYEQEDILKEKSQESSDALNKIIKR